jgi:hypothetical protein
MRSLLIRCYPARWRARYGDEFEAILEERPLGPFDVADILLGALDAQLRLRGRGADIAQGRGLSMSLRIGGIAAIIGSALLAVAGFLGSGILVDVDGPVPWGLLLSGMLALLVALAGLSAFQARTHPRLAWAAFALPAVGTIVCIAGIVGIALLGDRPVIAGISSWYVSIFGILGFFVGSVLFATATYRTAVLSRRAALLLGVGSVLTIVIGLGGDRIFPPQLLLATMICFALGWFVLGLQAIRIDRPAIEPRPA